MFFWGLPPRPLLNAHHSHYSDKTNHVCGGKAACRLWGWGGKGQSVRACTGPVGSWEACCSADNPASIQVLFKPSLPSTRLWAMYSVHQKPDGVGGQHGALLGGGGVLNHCCVTSDVCKPVCGGLQWMAFESETLREFRTHTHTHTNKYSYRLPCTKAQPATI